MTIYRDDACGEEQEANAEEPGEGKDRGSRNIREEKEGAKDGHEKLSQTGPATKDGEQQRILGGARTGVGGRLAKRDLEDTRISACVGKMWRRLEG